MVLVLISLMRHIFNQCLIIFRLIWRFLWANVGSMWDARIAVSSAYVAFIVFFVIGRFAVYKGYSIGQRALH